MRPNILLTLFILCYLLPNFLHAFQITSHVSPKDPIYSSINSMEDTTREKRELESLENEDFPSGASKDDQADQEGFWDKVVKVALKLFSRFIEWLNSS